MNFHVAWIAGFAMSSLTVVVLAVLLFGDGDAASSSAIEPEGADDDAKYGPYPPLDLLFDFDYDDSWVEMIPDVIGGWEVRTVRTPKNMACLSTAQIGFRSPYPSVEEYLAAPIDLESLRAEIDAIVGEPGKVGLSFSSGPIVLEEDAAWLRDHNSSMIKYGCPEPWGGPIPDIDDVTYFVTPNQGTNYVSNWPEGPWQTDPDNLDERRSVFDLDYDDSWVESFPETIGGLQVYGFDIPKNRPCYVNVYIILESPYPTLDDWESSQGLDIAALCAEAAPFVDPDSVFVLIFTNQSLESFQGDEWTDGRYDREFQYGC